MIARYLKNVVKRLPPVRALLQSRDEAWRETETLRKQVEELAGRLRSEEDQKREYVQRMEELERRLRAEEHQKKAYAHWGEDQILSFVFKDKTDGFYVDVGCYHPALFSNTKLLHDRGWTGINIDPNPFMISEFNKQRPTDINLNIGLSGTPGTAEFFLFHDWASSNTMSADFANRISEDQKVEITQRMIIETKTLRQIFETYTGGREVDFLNIDVESVDAEVLMGNDWERFHPALIAIEDFEFEFTNPAKSRITEYLRAQNYAMFSRTIYTSFFIARDHPLSKALRID